MSNNLTEKAFDKRINILMAFVLLILSNQQTDHIDFAVLRIAALLLVVWSVFL